MLSFWILLILVFSCEGQNNSWGCDCDRSQRRDRKCDFDHECRRTFGEPGERRRRDDDCDKNDFIQPRPFTNFPGPNTCGCENKSE